MKRTRKTDGGDKVLVLFPVYQSIKFKLHFLLMMLEILLQKETKSSPTAQVIEKQEENGKGEQNVRMEQFAS